MFRVYYCVPGRSENVQSRLVRNSASEPTTRQLHVEPGNPIGWNLTRSREASLMVPLATHTPTRSTALQNGAMTAGSTPLATAPLAVLTPVGASVELAAFLSQRAPHSVCHRLLFRFGCTVEVVPERACQGVLYLYFSCRPTLVGPSSCSHKRRARLPPSAAKRRLAPRGSKYAIWRQNASSRCSPLPLLLPQIFPARRKLKQHPRHWEKACRPCRELVPCPP